MDATTLDRLARQASALPRRRLLLVVSALFGGVVPPLAADISAKRKKHCKKPKVRCGKKCCAPGECRFKKKGKRWKLKANCTITRSIALPNGVTLDGTGKTITMAGVRSGYTRLAGLFAGSGGAKVVNLTIDGRAITDPCPTDGESDPSGILFQQTSGRIENVTIHVTCGAAIGATNNDSATERSIEVANAKLTAAPLDERAGVGINFAATGAGGLVANISGSDFTAAAVLFNTNVDATVDGCTVAAGFISGLNGPSVTVTNTTITNAIVGIIAEGAGTSLTATGNTIVGPDDDQGLLISGIDFRPGSTGSVNGNAISNYVVEGPGEGCGIRVAPGATPAIGTNSFPPPGNDQNVCLT